MSWDTLFTLANALAALCWLVLIALPRTDLAKAAIFYVGVGLLCLTYSIVLVLLLTGIVDGDPVTTGRGVNFVTIEGVRNIFMSDGGVTVGWIHYLAFDLFVGLWIARDGDHKQIGRGWQIPALVLTFLAGPVGLLIWLIIREPAARRANPRKGFKL